MRTAVACAVALLAAGCASAPAPAVPLASNAPGLGSFCEPAANRPASVPGDAAYDLRLINNGGQPVQVARVAVIFYGANGTEIGSDDPGQQDFPGDQEPINSFNTILIGAGQPVTISMETSKISGAPGNWTCQLGSWSG